MTKFQRFPVLLFAVLSCCACTSSFKPFKFAHLTDTQIGFFDNSEGYAHSDSLFRAAAGCVNSEGTDLVFITGDLLDNPTDSLQNALFEAGVARMDAPVWLVPGNHDYGKAWSEEVRDRYVALRGYERFSFKHKKCAFIGLDSNCIMEDAAEEEAVQKEWLRNELSKARKCRYIFVFFHCPVFRKDIGEPHDYSNFPEAKREEYISIFKEYGVSAVFTGHTHSDYDFEYEGIRFVTANPVSNALGHGYPGYNIVDVGKDGFDVRSCRTPGFDIEKCRF